MTVWGSSRQHLLTLSDGDAAVVALHALTGEIVGCFLIAGIFSHGSMDAVLQRAVEVPVLGIRHRHVHLRFVVCHGTTQCGTAHEHIFGSTATRPGVWTDDGFQHVASVEHVAHVLHVRRIERGEVQRRQGRTTVEHVAHVGHFLGIEVLQVSDFL